jgi:hypothetical protein
MTDTPPTTAQASDPAHAADVSLFTWAHRFRRAHQSWNELEDGEQDVPDFTLGGWPTQCAARWPVDKVPYFCTRITDHTGRHAAGNLVRIVAVW